MRPNGRPAVAAIDQRAPRNIQQHEYAEQCAFIQWCARQPLPEKHGDGQVLCLADVTVASLNGAYLAGDHVQRSKQWARMARAGAKRHAPDIAIDYPANDFHGMRIEMKRNRKDFRSPSEERRAIRPGQLEYLELMNSLGYFSVLAYGWIEAALETCKYLGWDPQRRGLV